MDSTEIGNIGMSTSIRRKGHPSDLVWRNITQIDGIDRTIALVLD